MTQAEMKKILELGVYLSSERDLGRLLERVLNCVVDLAHCDGGTLYILEGDELRFRIMRNDSMGTYARDPDLPPVPMRRENVCGLTMLERRTVVVDDVYHCPDFDFSGPARYDKLNRYHTQSMLTVPMVSREGNSIGVIQLINALDGEGNICSFTPEMVLAVESAASQAAVTIQNARYIAQIRELFYSFVRVLSDAIDERTPYNASHSRHMAEYGERFLRYLNSVAPEGEVPFDDSRREELLMSIWLHDVGKLATPLEVMNKELRLRPEQHTAFVHRMEVIRLLARIDLLSGKISEAEYEALLRGADAASALVEEANGKGLWDRAKRDALDALAARTYTGADGQPHPWLEAEEHRMLSIRKGTLSEEERQIMERHVVLTDLFLSEIQFPADLSHVRAWAAAHHEFLDGEGYPNRLKGDEIPEEVRIITILDVFDALVADDRPYKPGKPVPEALKILTSMADAGKLDRELLARFIESRCWEPVENAESSRE